MVTMIILLFIFNQIGKYTDTPEKNHNSAPKHYFPRFAYFNPNPTDEIDPATGEPAKWKKGDCVVRAFCGVLDLPWEEVYSDLCAIGAEYHDLPNSDQVWKHYAKQKGLARMKRPDMNVSEFAASHDGVYLVMLKSHAVCVKGNKVQDCSDSGWGRIRSCYEIVGTPSNEMAPSKRKRKNAKGPSDIEKEVLAEMEKNGGLYLPEDDKAFVYFNPNPEAVVDEAGRHASWNYCDNVIRAFCGVLNLSWQTVYTDLCKLGKEMHDMPDSRDVIIRYAKEQGLIKKTLSSSMTLSSFAKTHDGEYLIQFKLGLNPELTCIKENKVYDIWGYGSRKFRTYYVKAS